MTLLGYVGFIAVLVAGSALYDYWTFRHQYGPSIARGFFPQQLASLTLMMIVINLNSFASGLAWDLPKAALWVVSTILLWSGFTALALRKPETGEVLLDMGRLNEGQKWFLLVFGVLGTLMLFLSLIQSTEKATALSFGILSWSFVIVYALMSRKSTLLTEKGVRTGYTGFRWEQIKDYIWTNDSKGREYLFFKLKDRLPLMDVMLLRIPAEHRQQVNDVVNQQMRGLGFIAKRALADTSRQQQ